MHSPEVTSGSGHVYLRIRCTGYKNLGACLLFFTENSIHPSKESLIILILNYVNSI